MQFNYKKSNFSIIEVSEQQMILIKEQSIET